MKNNFSQTTITLILSFLFTLFYNVTFFNKTVAFYPASEGNYLFLLSLFFVLFLVTNLVFSVLIFLFNPLSVFIKKNTIFKSFFFLVLFLSMLVSYVMNSYGTVVDDTMLLNIFKTDLQESIDLLSWSLLGYFLVLFILPSVLLYKVRINYKAVPADLLDRLKIIGISILLIFAILFSFGKNYASFFREHKPLRYYTNPTYWIYSLGKYGGSAFKNPNKSLEALGRQSIIPISDTDRELIILVVGETARRDRFSLNGYEKETNPLLKKENVVSFTNVTSCGTSTAISVPCMFSNFKRADFDVEKGNFTENLLDVLSHTKDVEVLWRDNNSSSKGVANRVRYEDFKESTTNTVCDIECRDVGMIVGLQDFINKTTKKDIIIVLHQMGNHGPAYYKRYPKEFEKFKPVCKTNELEKCSNEEISNAYDNAILYTDYFLSSVIQLLKSNSGKFNTGMIYLSDHGESLGENGVYLHGLPYMMAPKEQKEVPMIMWFGGRMEEETDYIGLRKRINVPYSHDNLFHTTLGMFEIESSVYDPNLDILNGIHFHKKNKK